MRQSQKDSWRRAVELGAYVIPKADSKSLEDFVPELNPAQERLSFFRSLIEDCDLSDLTLDELDCCRCTFDRVTIVNSSLLKASMCWNDFLDCEFVSTDLMHADMRASVFLRCAFNDSKLDFADLRRSTFEFCEFLGASLVNTKLTYEQGEGLQLDKTQCEQIDWHDDAGPEPYGG